MMLDLLQNEYMAESSATPMDQQDLAEICKIAPNRETSLMLPGTQCLRPFSALDTPLCPRFMPRPWAFFRNTYLLHDIGAASPASPEFSNAGGSPVCCLGRVRPLSCPATRRDSNGLASARPAGVNTPHSCPGLALQFRDSEFAGFSFKNPAPTLFNPPSCGASIGDAPRFMGVR